MLRQGFHGRTELPAGTCRQINKIIITILGCIGDYPSPTMLLILGDIHITAQGISGFYKNHEIRRILRIPGTTRLPNREDGKLLLV